MKRHEIGNKNTMAELANIPPDGKTKLTVNQLACAMYEGMPHVQNLAERLARTLGEAQALTFYDMMDEDTRNFWRGIAKQLIDHSKEWLPNKGSCCILSEKELKRLAGLPRVTE
jgi:hypothetical protein